MQTERTHLFPAQAVRFALGDAGSLLLCLFLGWGTNAADFTATDPRVSSRGGDLK